VTAAEPVVIDSSLLVDALTLRDLRETRDARLVRGCPARRDDPALVRHFG